MTLAPPAPYFGGKQRIAQRLVDLFPPHEHYVEPYAGGLSILMAKTVSKLETVNDLDGDIMTFWQVLRDQPEELERACALTPHSRAEHRASREREGLTDVERARRVWVSLTQGRGGQLMRTGWRYYLKPSGTSMGMPGYLDGYVDRIAPAAERLHRVSLECRPALEVIDAYGTSPRALLYVDPPYLGETRGGRHATNAYVHEMKDEAEHRELSAALHSAAAAVILSGYPSPLYDDLYADWHVTDISAWTGQGNHGRSDGGSRVERLWSNVPLGYQQMLDLEGTTP